MKAIQSRREFFSDVGRGMLVATVGLSTATELGLAKTFAEEAAAPLNFGDLEPLVCLMQETAPSRLLPALVEQLRSGTELRRLVQAAAFANARTFGGEDYVGYHTMMALSPALHIAMEMPSESQALPVLKVLYRNTTRIQEHGGRKNEVLREIKASPTSAGTAASLRKKVHAKDMAGAEQVFARLAQKPLEEYYNDLLETVQDHTEVHRVVLPYRAWDLLNLLGRDQAHALLRQSVHYCVKAESWAGDPSRTEARTILPRLLDEHKLLGRELGKREVDDAWVDRFSLTLFNATPAQAAEAAAASLAEGIAPDAIGEALTLAANQLVLRDHGRTPREEIAGKPVGSVHGDSIGVHACDSANAWRNMARVSNPRNCFASLILGSYQLALDRVNRGGDFLNWQPLPVAYQVGQVKATDAETLLREADEAIRGNLQARVTAIVHRYSELGFAPAGVFALLRRYAISEDGALHAEKFYRTVTEEFGATREAFRWRHLLALARVTASEYGRPAAGVAEARGLLGI